MSCLNLTRCFSGIHPEVGGGGGGAAPIPSAPEASGNTIQRSKPYQDLSYEVVPTGAVPGSWTECPLDETLPTEDPAPAGDSGEGRSLLDRLRKLCTREKTPEEVEIELLRKERKEILKALKNYGINDKRLTLAKIKDLRANIEQVLEQERKKLPEPIEMQEMKSTSKAIAVPTLETNLDEVLPPYKEPSVDYPLTQLDPAPQTVGDGRRDTTVPKGERNMSWKLATPIALPDNE